LVSHRKKLPLTHRPDRLRIVLDPVVVDAQFQGAKTANLGGKGRGFIGQALSDLRQTAIDEYFASCHEAAVIGSEEQGCGSRFVRIANSPPEGRPTICNQLSD
jgi:hypothetical protein